MSLQVPCLRHVREGTPVSITALHAEQAKKSFTLHQLQNTCGMMWSAVAWLPECSCRLPPCQAMGQGADCKWHLGAAAAACPSTSRSPAQTSLVACTQHQA